jgi:hypothetical protein
MVQFDEYFRGKNFDSSNATYLKQNALLTTIVEIV